MKLLSYPAIILSAACFFLAGPGVTVAGSSAPAKATNTANCNACPPSSCGCAANCGCNADGHDYFANAPIGVMGDHIHSKGGLMASYRYMFMRMQGNYDGDSKISDQKTMDGYMMAAKDMDMQMHMLGLMYAPTDELDIDAHGQLFGKQHEYGQYDGC